MDFSWTRQGSAHQMQMKIAASREHWILQDIDPSIFRRKLLNLEGDGIILFDRQETEAGYKWLAGVGMLSELLLSGNESHPLELLDKWLDAHLDWRMGYVTYDFRNALEPSLVNDNEAGFEDILLHLWVPEFVFFEKDGVLNVQLPRGKQLPGISSWKEVQEDGRRQELFFYPSLSRTEYIDRIERLRGHIRQGDIYEINFCTEWISRDALEHPGEMYQHLWKQLQAPFSTFMKIDGRSLLCNSPERYISKVGNRLISQPIKGTAPRSADPHIDQINKEKLLAEKEKSENVMIVDLVRNDLSKVAETGSVVVDELFGTYTFNQVHQLISTISCELRRGVTFSEILKATFPMGSMTGAPKISAMELSERYEPMKRGLYSGTTGYMDPNGDFDFNVVIRSLISDSADGYTVARTGSAITWDSDAGKEWEECLVKISSMIS